MAFSSWKSNGRLNGTSTSLLTVIALTTVFARQALLPRDKRGDRCDEKRSLQGPPRPIYADFAGANLGSWRGHYSFG